MIHSLDLPVKLEDDILVSIEQHQTITKPASLGGTDTWLGCTGAPLPCGLRPRYARSSSPLPCGARAPNQLRCFNRATPDHNKTRLVGRVLLWWVWLGSNQRPLRCQRSAHTTELHTRLLCTCLHHSFLFGKSFYILIFTIKDKHLYFFIF